MRFCGGYATSHTNRSRLLLPYVPGDWCYWDKATWSDCRDCFVLKDNDQWIMYYCTRETEEYGGRPAFGIAVSEDLLNWKEVGHFTPPRCDTMLESRFVIKRENWYYFFYTKCGYGTAYFRSDNPFTGWECLNDEDEVVFPIVSCSEVLTYKGKEVMSAATRHHNELHFLAFYELFWHEDGTVENQIRQADFYNEKYFTRCFFSEVCDFRGFSTER